MTNINLTITTNNDLIHLTEVTHSIQGMKTSWREKENEVCSELKAFLDDDDNHVGKVLAKTLIDVIGEDFITSERAKKIVQKIKEQIKKGLGEFNVGRYVKVTITESGWLD